MSVPTFGVEVALLPRRTAGTPSDDQFWSFVRELARSPQAPDMIDRLREGHEPDDDGWCVHSAHSHHWEQHPCFTRRLADLADGPGGQELPEQPVAGDG